MKKTYLIAGLMIVLALFIMTRLIGEVTPYVDFATAEATVDGKVKIVGQLVKDKPMEWEPTRDPNYFSFFLRDQTGEEHKVVLLQGKPQDFELSEQIVLTGRMTEDYFLAREVQLKCPSKYKDEESFLKELSDS